MLIARPFSLPAFSATPGPACRMAYLLSCFNVAGDSFRLLDNCFRVPPVVRDMLDGMLCHCCRREDALVVLLVYLAVLYLLTPPH
jgi:hypothetical protein